MSDMRFPSVWDAIEDTAAGAENMKLRAALMMVIEERIRHQGLTQAEAGRQLGVTQPRVSDLMRGKIDLFSLDTLVNMAVAAGLHVELHVAGQPMNREEALAMRGRHAIGEVPTDSG